MNTTPFPSSFSDPLVEKILAAKPCREAVNFIKSFPTAKEAWDACQRPSWLFFALKAIGRFNKKETDAILTQILYKCQELALNDPSPRTGWIPNRIQKRILENPYDYVYSYDSSYVYVYIYSYFYVYGYVYGYDYDYVNSYGYICGHEDGYDSSYGYSKLIKQAINPWE